MAIVALMAPFGLAAPASAQAPVASFTFSPDAPLTQDPITFTSSSSGTILLQRWDLDDDGAFDDGIGATVTRAFSSSGPYRVRLQVIGEGGAEAVQSQELSVANRPPLASFGFSPAAPLSGEPVSFVSTADDPDGGVVRQAWDLDGDGSFDDATGATGGRVFAAPGTYTVALQVIDRDGAATITSHAVAVAAPPPTLLSPFPVVRLVGTPTRLGARVSRLDVSGPRGASVEVRCRGRGCPRGGGALRAGVPDGPPSPSGLLTFRRLRRHLRAGAVLQVRVRQAGRIGKYTRFTIRRGRVPARRDLCLLPGVARPVACPA